jgi:hypothetical protein
VEELLRQVQQYRILLVRLLADVRLSEGDIIERVRTIEGVLNVSVEPLSAAPRTGPPPAPPAADRAGTLAHALVEGQAAGFPPVAPPHLQPVPAAPELGANATTEQLLAAAAQPSARMVRVEFDGDDYRLYQLLAELLTRGLPVYGFTEEIGDLEDAFMRITKGLVA